MVCWTVVSSRLFIAKLLFTDHSGSYFRLQNGDVLSECGGSEYTSGPTTGESTSVSVVFSLAV